MNLVIAGPLDVISFPHRIAGRITSLFLFAPHLDPLPRYSLRGGGEEANAEVILPAILRAGDAVRSQAESGYEGASLVARGPLVDDVWD